MTQSSAQLQPTGAEGREAVVERLSPLAGQPARPEMLVDPARLVREYHQRTPDPADPAQLVSFGTSGHRGSPGPRATLRLPR